MAIGHSCHPLLLKPIPVLSCFRIRSGCFYQAALERSTEYSNACWECFWFVQHVTKPLRRIWKNKGGPAQQYLIPNLDSVLAQALNPGGLLGNCNSWCCLFGNIVTLPRQLSFNCLHPINSIMIRNSAKIGGWQFWHLYQAFFLVLANVDSESE